MHARTRTHIHTHTHRRTYGDRVRQSWERENVSECCIIYSKKVMQNWQFHPEIIISFQQEDKTIFMPVSWLQHQLCQFHIKLAMTSTIDSLFSQIVNNGKVQWVEHLRTPTLKSAETTRPTSNVVGKAWMHCKFLMSILNCSIICRMYSRQNLNFESYFTSCTCQGDESKPPKYVFVLSFTSLGE